MATTLDVALPAPDLLAALKDVVGYFDGKADQLQKTMCELFQKAATAFEEVLS